MAIDDYISQSRRQGSLHSEGVFTIDTLKADQKLTDFHREHPGFWILPLLQAASKAQSAWISIKIQKTSVELQFATHSRVPTYPLSAPRDEYVELLTRGVKGVFYGEPAFKSFTVSSLDREGQFGTTTVEKNRPVQETEFQEADQARISLLQTDSSYSSHVLIQVQICTSSWWATLKDSLRFRAGLSKALGNRLDYSVIPIIVDGKRKGLGSNIGYQAAAAEYILAAKHHDSFVREMEPGNGADVFDAFGTLVESNRGAKRFLVCWSTVESPLFESLSSGTPPVCIRLDQPRQISAFNSVKHSKPGEIPILKDNKEGSFFAHHIVKFAPEFQLERPRFWVKVHQGIPASVLLVVPPEPGKAKDSYLMFYRHGILLDKIPISLLYPGAWCLVACPELNTDFSGMRVVEDKAFFELEKFLNERLKLLIKKALRVADSKGRKLSSLQKWVNSQSNF